jgi:hypothetical protein
MFRSSAYPLPLGNAANTKVRLIVWCETCGHQVEPDPTEMVASIRRGYAGSRLARAVGVLAVWGSQYRHGGKWDRAAARALAEAAPGCLRSRRRPSINQPGAVYAERGYSSPVRLANDESLPSPASGHTLEDLPICCAERLGPATSVVRNGSDHSAGRPTPL